LEGLCCLPKNYQWVQAALTLVNLDQHDKRFASAGKVAFLMPRMVDSLSCAKKPGSLVLLEFGHCVIFRIAMTNFCRNIDLNTLIST